MNNVQRRGLLLVIVFALCIHEVPIGDVRFIPALIGETISAWYFLRD